MDYYCLIQVRLEGREIPVDIGYSQGTSVQAVLERACRTLGIYDSWNYALYSELFKTWLCETHLLSSYPAEDTLIVRKKTPEYLELVYNEENPKKRSVSSNNLSHVQTVKRRGVFSSTKTCLKTRFQPETIYLSVILFTSDSKILITSGSTKMFPTIEVIKDSRIFGNFEDDSEEFAHVIRTSLDWATSTEFDSKDDDSDSLHSSHSNGDSPSDNNNSSQFYGDQDTQWARAFGQAALKLKNELSLESLGTLYEHVVQMNTSKSKFIVALQHIPNCIREEIAPDLIKSGVLKWKNFDETSSIYQKDPHPVWSNYIEKWCSRQTKLSPGLYLGVLYTESTLQGIKILVPKDRKQFIPLGKVRDEATITPEEASWIKSLTCLSQDCFMDLVMATRSDHDNNKSTLGQFQSSFLDCYHKLQLDTNLSWESGDIYGDQTVDIYLDLQTNQMYTMMGELDDNIIEQCGNSGNPSSPQNDLYLDPNVNNYKNFNNNNNNNKFKNIYKSNSNNNSNSKLHQLRQQQDDDERREQKDESQKFQKGKEFEKRKQRQQASDEYLDSAQGSEDEQEVNYVIDADDNNVEIDKGKGLKMTLSAPESEVDEDEGGSMVKTCTSTGAATSVAEEVASSISSFNVGNTIRPFIRIILIVKPMRQPHQIRGPYYSRLCMLYPFPLYDALQHATFNTSLYACSRRAMQILQASRTYFTQELVKRLQKVDNFSEVNEQNLEDFFFDPDEFNKVPDDARKIQQALDVIRDEIVTLRQQWNATSWTMTAIEWDRQRTMQAYSFGGRPMTLNVSKTSQSRAASVYNLSLSSNNTDDDGINRKRLSTTSRISSDTVSQIEILRDVMFHAPDRAWNHIRFLGIPMPSLTTNNSEVLNNNTNNNGKDKKKKQSDKQPGKISSQTHSRALPPVLAAYLASSPVIIAPPTINRSSSLSSTISTISSNASSGGINSLPSRKRSAGHRFMRTFGFGGNRSNNVQQQNVANSGESSDLLNIANNNQSKGGTAKRTNSKKMINFDDDDTITITVPATNVQPLITTSEPLIPSFTLEPTELLEVKKLEIQSNDKSENNVEKESLSKIDDVDEYVEVSKNITENVQSQSENEITMKSKLIPKVDLGFQNLVYTIESHSEENNAEFAIDDIKSSSETSTINAEEDTNVNLTLEVTPIKEIADTIYEENIIIQNKSGDNEEIVKTKETFIDDVNYKNIDLKKEDETDTDENLNVSNKLLATVSEDSINNLLATSNSTSTCTSTTHTTTTSATDTPLSSRASSSPSTPHPHPPPSTPTSGLVLAQQSLSNASFPSSVPSTPHFPPPLFSQSIPPTPSTPYFPAEFSLSLSPETSRPETPEFPHDLPNELSAPPTPQLIPQTSSDIDNDSLLLAPLSSPSSETPLHTSIPSTPQLSPSAQNSRPSTPQLNSPTLFEELTRATSQLASSPTHTLYEELIQHTSHTQRTKSPPLPFQNSKPPTPQVSPPISPSLLPSLPLSIPSTPRSSISFHFQSSSNTSLTEKLPSPTTTSAALPLVNPISKISTSSISISPITTSSIQSFSGTLRSPSTPSNPSMLSRSPLIQPVSVRSKPPPLPLPPTWPTLKKTKKLEPKSDGSELETDRLTFQRSRTTSLSEGNDLESKQESDANKHLQRAASDDSLVEYNAHIDLDQQQKINNDDGDGFKVIYKNYYSEPTRTNDFLMDIKSTSSTNEVPARSESDLLQL